jgi:hypothetical protein
MSSLIVNNLAGLWEADPSGLWLLNITVASSRFGEDGLGMAVAGSGANTDRAPFGQPRFDPMLDLHGRRSCDRGYAATGQGLAVLGLPSILPLRLPAALWRLRYPWAGCYR